MKTIRQALIDDIHYPLTEGFIDNRLTEREINGESAFTAEVAKSGAYRGCYADCLYSLIEAPSFSEADKSISIADRNILLKKVNAIYRSIGEDEKVINQPNVYFGRK